MLGLSGLRTCCRHARSFATAALEAQTQTNVVKYPYFIPRNSNQALPVYTDIRNGGSRYLVLVRNVQGNVNKFAHDLKTTLLSEPGTGETGHTKIIVERNQLIIHGGQPGLKNRIMKWAMERGF